MPEGASLKTSGRFISNGQQMFFELILTNTNYLLKYYNSNGKLKLMRPIKLPTKNIEFHSIENYLLCYVHDIEIPTNSQIILIKLDTMKRVHWNCQYQIPSKRAENVAINQLYLNN